MNAPQNRPLTTTRLVALALAALAFAGLGYLRFTSGDHRPSVPAGAHAGQLTLHSCTYDTENGAAPADCGTLVVRENRHNPRSRLIALPVVRIRSHAARPLEPIFRLQGGPGISNMTFPDASRFLGRHDIVLVGYRGVDGSSRLDCPEVVSTLKHTADFLAAGSMRSMAAAFRACARRLQSDGVDLAGYTIPERVDDFEAARRALGYRRIDLVSESAGTRTALVYAWRHPSSLHRSAMVGVNPPGHYLWDTKTSDEQLRRYGRLCAADTTCSGKTDNLVASMQRENAHLPGRFWFLPIQRGNVRLASTFGIVESTDASAPLTGPMTIQSWLAAAHGDASGFWLQSTLARMVFPTAFVWGDVASVGRIDDSAAKRYFAGHDNEILGSPGTHFIWVGGKLVNAWPAATDEAQYTRPRISRVETLLIGGDLDRATPVQVATKELLPYLPNGHQVVLRNFGHADTFWGTQKDAGTHLLETFFDTGRVDASRYTPQRVDFTPGVTLTALGKGFAGLMIGLAALVVVSLLLMARRVHSRGRIGRKASVLLRAVYAPVLGLGGWFLGLLIVLTASPATPIDDQRLAVLAVGLPVAACIHYACADRSWTARTRTTGLVVAAVGALAGAWLGFHAGAGLLALVTAIVGAVAGSNLAVVVRDIGRARAAQPSPVAVPVS
jgi:pimeloyl-ACP methyl ester carboxylesterase